MNEMNIHASYPKFNLQGLAQFNSNIANILNDFNNNLANSLSQSVNVLSRWAYVAVVLGLAAVIIVKILASIALV